MEIVFESDTYGFDRNDLDGRQMYFVWFEAKQGETEYLCFIRDNALTDCFGATLDEKDLLSTFEQNRYVIEDKARQKIRAGSITSAKTIPRSTGKEVWLRRSHFPGKADTLVLATRSVVAAQKQALAVVPLLERGDLAGVREASEAAARIAADALRHLRTAGVRREAFDTAAPGTPAAPTLAPDELALLNRSDVRALLDGVAALIPLAERVDQARGRWPPEHLEQVPDPDAPATDTKGTDLAETLHQLASRLYRGVYGPISRESCEGEE